MATAAIYAGVSTVDYDTQRQLTDCREHLVDSRYDYEEVRTYADVEHGHRDVGRDDYQALWEAVVDGEVDLVVATEVSQLLRSGSQETTEFISTCLEVVLASEGEGFPVHRGVAGSLRGRVSDLPVTFRAAVLASHR